MDKSIESQGQSEQIEEVKGTSNIATNSARNNQTLFYIAVEYIKNDKQETNNVTPINPTVSEKYIPEFVTPHGNPLDPDMNSVAPYNSVSIHYPENSNNTVAPIIIHQYFTQEQESLVNHLTIENPLENLSSEIPSVLRSQDLPTDNQSYLQLIQNDNVVPEGENMQLISENDQQDVELLITDHATGVSYSLNTQELLVGRCLSNEQPFLDTINSNSLLGTDFFTLDDVSLKSQLSAESGSSEMVMSVNNETVEGFMSKIPDQPTEVQMVTRSNSLVNVEDEEGLLSCVYSITDKPILSRARASLPESYLLLTKINDEDAVFAKKRIPKRTQFGPLKGILDVYKEGNIKANSSFFILLEGITYNINVSDETNSNWMGFVRKAKNYEEQNLIITQEDKDLYFTSIRNILPKEELKVGYSTNYARQFNLETLCPPEKKSWLCYECSERFASSEELREHFSVHDGLESIENTKPKRKYKKTYASQTKKSLVEVVECNHCYDLFASSSSYTFLKNHLAEKHKIDGVNKIGEQFSTFRCSQCVVCNMRFKMDSLLNIHQLEHDSELYLDQANHVCPQCQRKFPTRKQLVLHVSSHKLPQINQKSDCVKCPVCHKLFAFSIRLQKHMLCHGSDENKPLQCKVCQKRFLTGSALAFHSKIHQTDEKQFECPICKERFDHVLKLRLHIPKHAHNNTYTCPHCKKVFSKYSFVRKHIRFHSERKHHCSHCTKSFSTSDNLKKHMLKHSDHREFLCADCGKQFKRKDKLVDHIKKLHLQISNGRVAKSRTRSVTTKEPMDFHRFIYKCHTCLVGFKRRGMLVNHLAKRHPDVRPDSVPELNLPILQTTRDYYCQYCVKVYKSSSKRKLHILKNHPGAALPKDNGQKIDAQPTNASTTFSITGNVTTRPKNCKWCHRQYARKSKLLQHIRKAHPNKLLEEDPNLKENCQNESMPILKENVSETVTNSCKDKHTTCTTNQPHEFNNVFEKNQITTDGNITEITPVVIEGLIDEDTKYCHLSIVENNIMETAELDNENEPL
ncbi:hypothetical protein ABEB36_008258 [Hypothenemus hampei]